MKNLGHPALLGLALVLVTTIGARNVRADDPEAIARLDALTKSIDGQLGEANAREMYVFVDKPLYHPGETVWFRAFEVARKSLTSVAGEHGVTFELLDPRGAKVLEKRVLSKSGVATNDFALPAGIVGGAYLLRATSDGGVKEERAITVSTYELPRVRKTIDFGRTTYSPGDRVTATVMLSRVTGEPMTGAKVTAVISVDGNDLARFQPMVDGKGRAFLVFDLPRRITKGEVFVNLQVDVGGVVESMQRRIPVTLDEVTVTAFPEGGDLVSGLPSRVYLAGRDPQGKPAEIEGRVMDETGRVVTTFKSVHAGMARVAMTPQEGHKYFVKLTHPSRDVAFPIPVAKSSGCTLETEDDYRSSRADIVAKVRCTTPQRVFATAVLRDKIMSRTTAETRAGEPTEIHLPTDAARGAVRVTLWVDDRTPVAERLVYRGLGNELRVSVTADKASYVPRERVTLTVKATDASGAPAKADFALAVVDDAVINLADDKSPNILADLYLLPEMPGQRVHEPNFYYSSDKKAPESMDLLMGTQGFRRFTWKWVK